MGPYTRSSTLGSSLLTWLLSILILGSLYDLTFNAVEMDTWRWPWNSPTSPTPTSMSYRKRAVNGKAFVQRKPEEPSRSIRSQTNAAHQDTDSIHAFGRRSDNIPMAPSSTAMDVTRTGVRYNYEPPPKIPAGVDGTEIGTEIRGSAVGFISVASTGKSPNDTTKSQIISVLQNDNHPSKTVFDIYNYTLIVQQSRNTRFPSVRSRIRHYMGSWYLPPCMSQESQKRNRVAFQYFHRSSSNNNNNSAGDSITYAPYLLLQEVAIDPSTFDPPPAMVELGVADNVVNATARFAIQRIFRIGGEELTGNNLFYLSQKKDLSECRNDYCRDVLKWMHPALEAVQRQDLITSTTVQQEPESRQTTTSDELMATLLSEIPILLQYGDSQQTKAWNVGKQVDDWYPAFPFFRKFRHVVDRTTISTITKGGCQQEPRSLLSNPRGVARMEPIVWLLTHKRHFAMLPDIPAADRPWSQKRNAAIYRGALTGIGRGGLTPSQMKRLAVEDACQRVSRCSLVYNNYQSKLVNASLVGKRWDFPDSINGVPIFSNSKLSYGDLMEYKGIILLEGNDLSSGFKWALLSNSVVLSPPLTYASWAMEDMLEPWIHFVPIKLDLSDVESQMEWVLQHDVEAQQIARRGQLWMLDLVFHPDSIHDDEMINIEMIQRYRQHFVHNPYL